MTHSPETLSPFEARVKASTEYWEAVIQNNPNTVALQALSGSMSRYYGAPLSTYTEPELLGFLEARLEDTVREFETGVCELASFQKKLQDVNGILGIVIDPDQFYGTTECSIGDLLREKWDILHGDLKSLARTEAAGASILESVRTGEIHWYLRKHFHLGQIGVALKTLPNDQIDTTTLNILGRRGISTLDDLSAETEEEVRQIPNLGPTRMGRVTLLLATHGKKFAEKQDKATGQEVPGVLTRFADALAEAYPMPGILQESPGIASDTESTTTDDSIPSRETREMLVAAGLRSIASETVVSPSPSRETREMLVAAGLQSLRSAKAGHSAN